MAGPSSRSLLRNGVMPARVRPLARGTRRDSHGGSLLHVTCYLTVAVIEYADMVNVALSAEVISQPVLSWLSRPRLVMNP